VTELYFAELSASAKAFAGLTPVRERLMREMAPLIVPQLDGVTNRFYAQLQLIPRTAPFLEGRLPMLRRTHRAWLERLFVDDYDGAFVAHMYEIGNAHVRVQLPLEFMAGGITMIAAELTPIVLRLAAGDPDRQAALLGAVNAALGFSLMVMQESYQISRMLEEQEHFLTVTGISRDALNDLVVGRRP
jgi:hypothetical protein